MPVDELEALSSAVVASTVVPTGPALVSVVVVPTGSVPVEEVPVVVLVLVLVLVLLLAPVTPVLVLASVTLAVDEPPLVGASFVVPLPLPCVASPVLVSTALPDGPQAPIAATSQQIP